MAASSSRVLSLGIALLWATCCLAQAYRENLSASNPAIQYFEPAPDNPATRLMTGISQGRIKLEFRADGLGYLPDLLRNLDVNPDSQMLTFGKSSFQADRISPRNPRAIYFNDQIAVGYVRGGDVLEIAASDARQGVVFYTLPNSKTGSPPAFSRQEVCLKCHQGPSTMGVPGIFIGSVFPNQLGVPAHPGAIVSDYTTPFEDRWGGWFVNAGPGAQLGRGNSVAPDPAEPTTLEPLAANFNPTGYLNPVSDIVALMTFEYQTQALNLLTRLGWEARMGMNRTEQMGRDIDAVIRTLTFADEAPLPHPVEGVSTFSRTFGNRGARDKLGRSLRDFDLQTRLFRYPLSYIIYSRQFEALPGALQESIYRGVFKRITGESKQAAFEILRDTKPNLPEGLCPDSKCSSGQGAS